VTPKVAVDPGLSRPPFPPTTRPQASANPHESFPCIEFAGNAAVEPCQGAPPSEETTAQPQKFTSPDLEPLPDASPTPCDPTATSPTFADVRRRLPVSPCVPGFNPLGFLLVCASRRGRQTSAVDFPFNPTARVRGYPFVLSQALTGRPRVSALFFSLTRARDALLGRPMLPRSAQPASSPPYFF
jgi:hypothetical protein